MSRIVLEGTARRLYRLRARDLPPDNILEKSYWRYVDFSGFDLSAYSMVDMDIIDCVGTGVRLPSGPNMRWMQSRRTAWAGAVLPPDISSYNHDLVVEWCRQRLPSLTGKSAAICQIIIDRVGADYGASWQDTYYHIVTTLALSIPEARDAAVAVFTGQKRLLSRLDWHRDAKAVHVEKPIAPRDPQSVEIIFPAGRIETENIQARVQLLKPDRHAAREAVRTYLRDKYGGKVEMWFAQLEPYPVIFVRALDDRQGDEEWYQAVWPDG